MLTVATAELTLMQPAAVVSVSEYVVVTVGETVGLEFEEVKPEGEDVQLYVLPDVGGVPMVSEPPAQMRPPGPASEVGTGFTPMTTELDLEQPVAVIVCVSVYVVISVGDTVGFETVDVKPTGSDTQLYVVPLTGAAPMAIEPPGHIALFEMTAAAGSGFTVTVTLFDLTQPVAAMVSLRVYVVLPVGETVALETLEVNPEGFEVQLYVLPATAAAPIVVELPLQTDVLEPVAAAGSGFTATGSVLELLQPVDVIVCVSV